MDGRQNDAFSCFIGALKHLRKLNGYGADYAILFIMVDKESKNNQIIIPSNSGEIENLGNFGLTSLTLVTTRPNKQV